MTTQTPPRIILHSDLHLESGPFTYPNSINDGAVAVFAGDVCSGEGGPAALKGMTPLPKVYVAGNHEFWGGDYYERLDAIKVQAKVNGVHFLENQAVVVEGVRFLGATLWTDYGGGHPALMSYGLWNMRDHVKITAKKWWTPANRARFLRKFGEHALGHFDGKFNPLLAMELHKKSKAWLKKMLAQPFNGPTVIVSHHAPSYESLLRAGIHDYALNREAWHHRRSDDLNLTKVGSYASDLMTDLRYELTGAGVVLWCHGHLHQAMHYGVSGVQVATNPRGRVHAPLTKDSARAYSFFGMSLSDADIERSQQAHAENPEDGDGFDYSKSRSFSLVESGYQVVADEHLKALTELEAFRAELRDLQGFACSKRPAIADLAGHRADTLWAGVLNTTKRFAETLLKQMGPRESFSLGLDWMLGSCQLVKHREIAAYENTGDYSSLLRWKQLELDRSAEERKMFGFTPERHTAKAHLKFIEHKTATLIKVLKRAPSACLKLKAERERMHRFSFS